MKGGDWGVISAGGGTRDFEKTERNAKGGHLSLKSRGKRGSEHHQLGPAGGATNIGMWPKEVVPLRIGMTEIGYVREKNEGTVRHGKKAGKGIKTSVRGNTGRQRSEGGQRFTDYETGKYKFQGFHLPD